MNALVDWRSFNATPTSPRRQGPTPSCLFNKAASRSPKQPLQLVDPLPRTRRLHPPPALQMAHPPKPDDRGSPINQHILDSHRNPRRP